MKIKYKGIKYKLPVKAAIKYKYYRIILFFKRQWRRLIVCLNSLNIVLSLIPVWALFILGLTLFGGETFCSNLADAKFSIFSSVVITGFITLKADIRKYKQAIHDQFNIYVDFMCAGDDIIEAILKKHYKDFPHNLCTPRSIFFTQERTQMTKRIIMSINIENLYDDSIKECYDRLEQYINEIKYLLHQKRLLVDERKMYYYSCWTQLGDLKSNIENEVLSPQDVIKFMRNFEGVIDELRVIWRRDLLIDQNIREILDENNAEKVYGGNYDEYYDQLFLNSDIFMCD